MFDALKEWRVEIDRSRRDLLWRCDWLQHIGSTRISSIYDISIRFPDIVLLFIRMLFVLEKKLFISVLCIGIGNRLSDGFNPFFGTRTRTRPLWGSVSDQQTTNSIIGVVSTLKYIQCYPCLELRFPQLNETLDFLVDTGANVNTIGAEFAAKHQLKSRNIEGQTFRGTAGVGGFMESFGNMVALGDCELVGLPPEQTTTFMTNLSAAALDRPTPVGDGILGLAFLLSFPAGVEFDFHGTDGDPPTMIFYYGENLPRIESVRKNLVPISLKLLPIGLLTLQVCINGQELTVILDTGSPVTVLSPEAALKAGIVTSDCESNRDLHVTTARRQTYGDKELAVIGTDGVPVLLRRSERTNIPLDVGSVSLGSGHVYIGELPGLSVAGKLTDSIMPGVVLGLDALRRNHRMILQVAHELVWFEERQ